ncbi:MAG: hypothetical protein R3Y67_06075 [Eubacteriales bacterium]
MAFGFKAKNVKFSTAYSVEALYEKIKEQQFSAGKPILTKYMNSQVIVFPALNSKNQVQILKFGFKGESATYTIQKGDELSLDGAVKNLVVGEVTKGYSNLGSAFGDIPKECMRLVDETVKELTALHL